MTKGLEMRKLLALMVLLCSATSADAATCLLQVKGETFINGPCDYELNYPNDGDFYIGAPDGSYFAYFSPNGVNTISVRPT